MQDLIRKEFSEWTIIAVAHRLQSVMDFDTIAVLDKGHIVELGAPHLPLERDGLFRKL